jgi:HD superfamily phosphohydrolase
MSMTHYTLYQGEIPAVLAACANTPCMQRLKNIGMNCGCEYTSFPRFAGLKPYSRFDHSLGVGLIVWHFTHDEKQAAAGLLHDVASPVFAHVVDFLRGDYLVQESTEDGTRAIIERDEALQDVLSAYGLNTDDVCDYHRYPIADNDSPRLSADRLEYTLGNLLNYRIRTSDAVNGYYRDLLVGVGEDGQPELAFSDAKLAEDFAFASLACSKIYVSDEDRYAMQMLAELLRHALDLGVLSEADLMSTEPAVIEKLLCSPKTAAAWKRYRAYRAARRRSEPKGEGDWRRIPAKKRYIDPLIAGVGRVSAYSDAFRAAKDAFLSEPQTDWVAAD